MKKVKYIERFVDRKIQAWVRDDATEIAKQLHRAHGYRDEIMGMSCSVLTWLYRPPTQERDLKWMLS